MYERYENTYKVVVGITEERNHLKFQCVNGTIILKWF
jgi:hypothetical protein